MAEVIGVASGIAGLGTVALQSSVALYQTINSYQSHQQRVRDLAEEAGALSGVLESLIATVGSASDLDFSALEIPLKRCGKACDEFKEEIQKCSARSGGSRASFRDWARLKYMGDDVDGFRRLLASYKMTITVALTDATLRKSVATADSIEGYTDLLNTARADLEDRLERIDEKLDVMLGKAVAESTSDVSDVVRIKEEKLSTEKSLEICAQLSEHIGQIQLKASRTASSGNSTASTSIPENITNEGLEECKHSLARVTTRLKNYEKDLFTRLTQKMSASTLSPEDKVDVARLREEWESTRESMDILSSADDHFNKTTSVIENHATGDAVQFMVSTDGKTLHGTNRGLGWRTRQVGGHMDNETVRQISKDMVSISIRAGENASAPVGEISAVSASEAGNERHSEFKKRYGEGFKLTQKSV